MNVGSTSSASRRFSSACRKSPASAATCDKSTNPSPRSALSERASRYSVVALLSASLSVARQARASVPRIVPTASTRTVRAPSRSSGRTISTRWSGGRSRAATATLRRTTALSSLAARIKRAGRAGELNSRSSRSAVARTIAGAVPAATSSTSPGSPSGR